MSHLGRLLLAACLLVTCLLPRSALASEPKKPRLEWDPWDIAHFPVIYTTFGGGSYTDKRLGVIGGDALAGWSILSGGEDHALVLTSTIGWSGWRTNERAPRLRANTFTGRLDLGYMNFYTMQGITVFGAGRVGTGRGPDPARPPTLLRGAQVGVTYWPMAGWAPHAGILGVEFQSNFNQYQGEWQTDLRCMVNFNAGLVFILVFLPWDLFF